MNGGILWGRPRLGRGCSAVYGWMDITFIRTVSSYKLDSAFRCTRTVVQLRSIRHFTVFYFHFNLSFCHTATVLGALKIRDFPGNYTCVCVFLCVRVNACACVCV